MTFSTEMNAVTHDLGFTPDDQDLAWASVQPGLEVGKFNMVNGQVAIITKRMESYSGSRDRATSMLLDEPTSAVVTPEIGFADQFTLLESGEPVHCAPPDEIFKHPEDKWIKPFLQTYHERNAI